MPASRQRRLNSSLTLAVCAMMKGRLRVGSCCARMTRVHSSPPITSIDASINMHWISWSGPRLASRSSTSKHSRPFAATTIYKDNNKTVPKKKTNQRLERLTTCLEQQQFATHLVTQLPQHHHHQLLIDQIVLHAH